MSDETTTPEPAVEETAVVLAERDGAPTQALATMPSPREWEATIAMATKIAATQFVPETYRGQPEAVVAAILTGREMGIGPMQALRQIHMIDGRPAFAADLMLSKMRQGGVVILDSESTKDRAWIKARRSDTGEEAEVEWTHADAAEAGLLTKKNYQRYPADMLWARCVGRLARRLGSDLLGGNVYAAEEVRDWDTDDAGGYDTTPPRPGSGGYFNPGRDLLPDAITGHDAARRIGEAFQAIDPTIDWRATVDALVVQAFKVERKDLGGQTVEFWTRLSNAIARIFQDYEPGTLPPPDDTLLQEAFGWAFAVDPGKVALPLKQEIQAAEAALAAAAAEAAAADDGDVEDAETVPIEPGQMPAADVPFGDDA